VISPHMAEGTCRLCGTHATLHLSHVVPAFVFRWLRKTSGTGHIRSTEEPNLRVQDGMKRFWFCSACEERLNCLNYNFNLKLRALGRVTPFEAIRQWYQKNPEIFNINTSHLIVGLNISGFPLSRE